MVTGDGDKRLKAKRRWRRNRGKRPGKRMVKSVPEGLRRDRREQPPEVRRVVDRAMCILDP